MATGWGRGRQVPHWTASSTTSASARWRDSERLTCSRYGPNRAWSSQTPRPQKRQDARAALAQNQQSTDVPFGQPMMVGVGDGVGGLSGVGEGGGLLGVVGGVVRGVVGGVVRGGVVRAGVVGRVVAGELGRFGGGLFG